MQKDVRVFINNVNLPDSLAEISRYMKDNDGRFNIEDLINDGYTSGWTVPPRAHINDISIFYHAKTAKQRIGKLKKEYMSKSNELTFNERNVFEVAFQRAESIYTLYGGKLFAIAQVAGEPFEDLDYNSNSDLHWKSRHYAPISDIFVLPTPIGLEEFKDFILLNRFGAITNVHNGDLDRLKAIIISKNSVPEFFSQATTNIMRKPAVDVPNFDLESEVIIDGETEGRKIQYYTSTYERKKKNRDAAIKIHGVSCNVCGFNFQSIYGPWGADFIEVHHLKPLCSKTEMVPINPQSDLVCVCSNCHRIIHRKKDQILSPDELRKMVRKTQKGRML